MNPSTARFDLFLSHASRDKPAARAFHAALTQRFAVFLDEANVPLAATFPAVIRAAQQNSRITVLLVSKNSQDAYYQQEELVIGIELSRANPKSHGVLPVYLTGRPKATDWNLFGIHILQSLDVQQLGGIPETAKKIEEFLAPNSMTDESRDAGSSGHPLHRFRRDAFVDADLIPSGLFDEFGKRFGSLVDQQVIIREANAYRREADPGDPSVRVIQPHRLAPAAHASAYDYWFYVFEQARLIGARMLAALVISVPDVGFEPANRTNRCGLLDLLATL